MNASVHETDNPQAQMACPWYQKPGLVKLNFSLVSMIMFGATVGFDGSMSGGLLALPQWTGFMDNPTGAWLGFINAIYWVTFGMGIPVAAWSADRYGRKKTVYSAFVPLIIGIILETAANSPAMWIVGRAFLGIPSSIFGNVVPLLVTECAYPKHRGILTSLYFTGYYIGANVAAWTTFGTRNYSDSWAWRVICILQIACPISGLPGLFLCPESPRWLISKDKSQEARDILIQTHGGGTLDEIVQEELTEIETVLAQEANTGTSNYAEIFRGRANLHRTGITVTLGIASQWVGNGILSYFLPLILDTVGVTELTDQTFISGGFQIWNLIFAIAGALAVDRFGRRKLFLLSFAIMFVSYIIITACSGVFDNTGKKSIGIAVIPFFFIYFAGYDIAITPLQVAYPVEIWPYHSRSFGLGLAWISMMVGVIFNVFVNPIALDAIGWKYYIVFVVVLLVYGVVVYFFFPETRGYTLEQMDLIFEGRDSDMQGPSSDCKCTSQLTDEKPRVDGYCSILYNPINAGTIVSRLIQGSYHFNYMAN